MASKDDRRSKELTGLDIDRRKTEARRDDVRRPMLSNMYEEIYVTSYVNSIHPKLMSKVHALSNLEGESELSAAEWAVANLASADAANGLAMRPLKGFASEMIKQGLVVDDKGKPVMAAPASTATMKDFDHYLLKTGS